MSLHSSLLVNHWYLIFRWSCLSLKLSSNSLPNCIQMDEYLKNCNCCCLLFCPTEVLPYTIWTGGGLVKKKKKTNQKTPRKGRLFHLSLEERRKSFISPPANRSGQFPGQTHGQDVAQAGTWIKCKLWVSTRLCSTMLGLFVALNEPSQE